MYNVGVINFNIYEDGEVFVGLASVVLPNKNQKSITVNGAGIGGDIEVPVPGQYDPMDMTMNFRMFSKGVAKLREPRRHTLDLRVAEYCEDPVTGTMKIPNVKHVMVVIPKSSTGGTVAPASPNEKSVVVSVRHWATYIDGEEVEVFDPINGINIINGVDYGAPVRKALGM
jgi:hypothetical protein